MKRTALWAGAALVTFTLSVGFVLFWLHGRGGAERRAGAAPAPASPDATAEPVGLCRVLAAPKEYEGRTVRVRATYFASVHGPRLYDRDCVDKEIDVSAVAPPDVLGEIAREMKDIYGSSDVPAPLEVVAVGRFDDNHPSHAGRTVPDNAPYRFELMRVEEASRVR